MIELNNIYLGNCVDVMKKIDGNSIDLTVTSPPYDKLRNHDRHFDASLIIEQLYRVTKNGGIAVWVSGDTSVNMTAWRNRDAGL